MATPRGNLPSSSSGEHFLDGLSLSQKVSFYGGKANLMGSLVDHMDLGPSLGLGYRYSLPEPYPEVLQTIHLLNSTWLYSRNEISTPDPRVLQSWPTSSECFSREGGVPRSRQSEPSAQWPLLQASPTAWACMSMWGAFHWFCSVWVGLGARRAPYTARPLQLHFWYTVLELTPCPRSLCGCV